MTKVERVINSRIAELYDMLEKYPSLKKNKLFIITLQLNINLKLMLDGKPYKIQ
jgi:hypothetical protein